jgi:hypothetical protein
LIENTTSHAEYTFEPSFHEIFDGSIAIAFILDGNLISTDLLSKLKKISLAIGLLKIVHTSNASKLFLSINYL